MSTLAQNSALSPMLTQYLEYKERHPDCLLFFQVGDFYELFFDDAVTVSRALNLTLTSRDKNNPDPVPMAGVPIHAVDGYLERLLAIGHSVAVVSQTENGSQGKGMVKRRLERIVTPGIGILGNFGETGNGTLVAAITIDESMSENCDAAIALVDVQNAAVMVREGVPFRSLVAEVGRAMPAEIILPHSVGGRKLDRRLAWIRELETLAGQNGIKFRSDSVTTLRPLAEIRGFASLAPLSKRATRLILNYVDEVTVDARVRINEISLRSYDNTVAIDAVTRRTLELVANQRDGGRNGTLLEYLDVTCTAGGGRMLRQWIMNPLISADEINRRQDALHSLKSAHQVRSEMRDSLKFVCDLGRISARLELKVVSPRELGAVRETISTLDAIKAALTRDEFVSTRLISGLNAKLAVPPELSSRLENLSETPPFTLQEGGIFRDGFNAELDRLRAMRRDGRSWILELENREKHKTGISSLKIKYNNVLGFFFEVTRANQDKVPDYFIRRQSTVNCERFTTTELAEREKEVLGAESRALELESAMFNDLREGISNYAADLRVIGAALSEIDVLSALAEVADRDQLVRADINDGEDLVIEDGRHPVLARVLGSRFVANSLEMTGRNFIIISGANMGGKSTYLRQAGLIVLMAQIGSFVPARAARIGVVDKIFARMGASDDLSEGESTFMVEMREISNILANATARSLLLIDEVGRGTATADGLAIARAILEWIVVRLKSRALFATHFHELTALESDYPVIQNLSVGAVEQEHEVIFTHHIHPGAASRSYGVEVAKLAGLPASLLERASLLLQSHRLPEKHQQQLSMFSGDLFSEPEKQVEEPADYQRIRLVADRIRSIDINECTPIEALNLLNTLSRELKTT